MTTHDPEMTAVVHREVSEALEALHEIVARGGGGSPRERVDACFRIFHNSKGALRLGGFPAPERIAHRVEDLLAELRARSEAPSSALSELMVQALGACLQAIEAGGDHPALAAIGRGLDAFAPATTATDTGPAMAAATDDGGAPPETSPDGGPVPRDAAPREMVRVDATRLDRLMELGSEYLAQHARARQRRDAVRDLAGRVGTLARALPGERERIAPLVHAIEAFVRQEEQELRRGAQLQSDFDHAMRSVRMQPLAVVVPQVRRMVAEVGRELGKKVHLVADHGGVELDREVLDTLREPLLHLIRNAIDHGLEPESERVARGKPPVGEIRLTARVAGAHVELRVSDDGRGIDRERVRARAAELGLITEGEGAGAVDAHLFAPGFSTATSVTTVSGRGVGLDVVRSRVAELGGQVFSTSGIGGAGVAFVLSVPASVVSMRGLAVGAGAATVVLPGIHVERALRVETAALGSVEGVTVMPVADGPPLPLRWLTAMLGFERASDPPFLHVVVVSDGDQRMGLVVDEVRGDTTFVIKRLPWNVRRVPGVIGVTHLGDAALALVIDVAHLIRHRAVRPDDGRPKVAPRRATPRILVADDSLTSRTLERNILIGAGYDVTVVEDGGEALRVLGEGGFDLLVSDVQMPVLDGFQLTRAVRADPRLAGLPIVLVTSLERPEDVAEGARAGADEYIVKGRFDQESLLAAVSRLL